MTAQGRLGKFGSRPRRPPLHRPTGAIGARRRRERRRLLPRRRVRVIACLVVVVLALGVGWLWLRDSSLVAVTRVSVTGATGPDAGQIRAALSSAARSMTTLDVDVDRLRNAVAPFPVVKDVRVWAHFPHAMRIVVIEEQPVASVVVDGRQIAVASDGTLLHDVVANTSLPQIPLRVPPGGRQLTDYDALGAVAVVSASPTEWLGRVSQVITVASHGLVAQIRGGPSIYFGDDSRLPAKWAAAAAVLVDAGSAGALYIDVTDPERPAAGAGSAASSDSSSSASSSGAGDSSAASSSASSSSDTSGSATDTGSASSSTAPIGG
jgi:cell division protein FtsQ